VGPLLVDVLTHVGAFAYMEVGMRRNPKAERRRHSRWSHHTRGWAHYSRRTSAYGDSQRQFNRRERREARLDLRRGREPFPYQPRGRVGWEVW
jgi:hypothetical protein